MGAKSRRFKSCLPDVFKKFLIVPIVGLLAACEGLPPQSPPIPAQPLPTATQNTVQYCDTVEKTGGKHDVMKKQEGTLNSQINVAGIPDNVAAAHWNYFKDFSTKKTIQLGKDYVTIIEACRANGWKLPSERQSSPN